MYFARRDKLARCTSRIRTLVDGISISLIPYSPILPKVLLLFVSYSFSRRRLTSNQSLRSVTQYSSPGGTAGRQPHHGGGHAFPPLPPANKECHQLLLHCDVGLRNNGGTTTYIGNAGSDVCRPITDSSSLPWQRVERDVMASTGSGGRLFPCGVPEVYADHVYESPTFEKRSITCSVSVAAPGETVCVNGGGDDCCAAETIRQQQQQQGRYGVLSPEGAGTVPATHARTAISRSDADG